MADKQNILLFGALGFIGTYITEAIIKSRSSFGRIVIFTSSSTATSKSAGLELLKSQGVEIIVGDVNNDSEVLNAYEGIYLVHHNLMNSSTRATNENRNQASTLSSPS